ncbi:HAD family hydrolase [Vibrio agarivorans]|uniref:HAD family hydrolase n=1 Tax=Vibrio agarivorans TaxID=153622 RepID=UPI0025B5219A|nr:HAD family phosphatase [Vibrio agarivorans]MDN3662386.1 HAD family phosphatase [Vibrio agarivorans]
MKAVLFDMDGLIFDTEVVYKQSWQHAAREQHLELTDAFYRNFIGVQDPECERMLVEHFPERFDITRYKRDRDQHFHTLRAKGIAIKPGFDALFNAIKQRSLPTAIVTSSHHAEVAHNFANTPYLSQFDLIITAENVEKGKPHPDCYLMACERLGLEAKDCLVLEDSNNGIKAALAAGCQSIMIPDLLPPDEGINERTIVLESLNEVIKRLPKLTS